MNDKEKLLKINFDFYRKVINEVKNLSLINDDVILDNNESLYDKYIRLLTNLLEHYNNKSLSRYRFIYNITYLDSKPYSIIIEYHVFDSKSNKHKVLFKTEIDFISIILNRNIKNFYKKLNSKSK